MKNFTRISLTFILLALIIGLAQFSSGFLIENYYNKFSSQNPKEQKFKIVLKKFDKKIFYSKANLELHIASTSNEQEAHIIPIEQKLFMALL